MVHAVFGVAEDFLPLELLAEDVDGLQGGLFRVRGRVMLQGEDGQGPERDAVAVFEDAGRMVFEVHADDVGAAGPVAAGGAHPEHVVVAPLDVDAVVVHEEVDDLVGLAAPVVDIADDVQMVDSQALDETGQGLDELVPVFQSQDGVIYFFMITKLVVVLVLLLVNELVEDVGEVLRHGLPDLGARVLGREKFRQSHEVHDRRPVPGIRQRTVPVLLPHEGQLLDRIIDKRAELSSFLR